MNTINRRRTQLSVVAVAALAIFAVAAVMLLAGGAPAQATTAALTPDDGAAQPRPQQTDPTPTPRHDPPERCPGEPGNTNTEAASVVSSGHIALFDVWWNPEELELTNSSCPPTVTHVEEVRKRGRITSPARDDRYPSNIDIAKTVIHIPNSARIDLSASTTYTETKYKDLWDADAKEDRDTDGDGTPEEDVGDRIVWALPACPPAGAAATDDLCIIFSAALLNPDDWKEGTKIEYLLDHVHQTDIDKQDPRYTLAYDVPAPDATGRLEPLWDSADAQVAEMRVTPGEYERPMLFFTSRGTYEFQVHIRGNPNTDKLGIVGKDGAVSKDKSVTSDMREYVIHVGAEADLGVTATATPSSPSPGDNVTVTITASNAGPETAPETGVDVTLPPGLTYASHDPAGDTFADDDGDGVPTWDAGSLASGASNTLTITATVDAETRGRELTVEAAISGTETVEITETNDKGKRKVEEYHVTVADPDPSNDTAVATITVATHPNVAPMFRVMRSVAEHSADGTLVGDPVKVAEPNSGDTLTFSLTGDGADQFTVSSVASGAQIAVASGAYLDYEVKSEYNLVLGVSDGKDANGNTDLSIDHTIGVLINLTDIEGDFSVTLSVNKNSATVGEQVTFTVNVHNSPVPTDQLHWAFVGEVDGSSREREASNGPLASFERTERTAETYTYHMQYWVFDGGNLTHRIETNRVSVTWSAP